MSTADRSILGALMHADFMRLTNEDGEETDLNQRALADLTLGGLLALAQESREVWAKFGDGSSLTVRLHEGD